MRKVTVNVQVKVVLNMDEGVELNDVLSDLNYDITSSDDAYDVEDCEMVDYDIVDSK